MCIAKATMLDLLDKNPGARSSVASIPRSGTGAKPCRLALAVNRNASKTFPGRLTFATSALCQFLYWTCTLHT